MLLWSENFNSVLELKDERYTEDRLSHKGRIEVDTYFYPTILGNLIIDEKEADIYTIEGDLKLPNGTIQLDDKLNFEVRKCEGI